MSAMAVAVGFDADSHVPTFVGVSLILHMGGMLLFLQKANFDIVVRSREIDDVDLIEAELERKLAPKPKKLLRQELAKKFLSLSLPKRPRGLRTAALKAPERKKLMMDVPKLKLGQKKLKLRQDMKLDLTGGKLRAVTLDQKLNLRERSAPKALPKLALVGTARAPRKILEQLKLAEKKERAMGMNIGKIDLGTSRRKFSGGPKIAAKTRTGKAHRLLSMLPAGDSAIKLRSRALPRREIPKFKVEEPAPLPTRSRSRIIEEVEEKKKAVEIEGPLSSRKVVEYSIPAFPQKLEDDGVYEAEVRIKFYVSPVGNVLEDRMSVERSSSYGWLDRLAKKHLLKWRFEPLPLGGRNEWGIITFRFFLE